MTQALSQPAPRRSLTSRLYESEHDLQQLQALLMAARASTDDWRYGHVGDLLWSFFMVDCHLKPTEHIRLWHDAGMVVGYAMTSSLRSACSRTKRARTNPTGWLRKVNIAALVAGPPEITAGTVTVHKAA